MRIKIDFYYAFCKVLKHRQHHHHTQITMQELRQQIEKLQQENMALELKVKEMSTYQSEVSQLRKDIQKLHQTNEMNNVKLNQMEEENEALRCRLRNVVQSPLSDTEKQQLIDDSQRLHSSAPASIALPNVSFLFIKVRENKENS